MFEPVLSRALPHDILEEIMGTDMDSLRDEVMGDIAASMAMLAPFMNAEEGKNIWVFPIRIYNTNTYLVSWIQTRLKLLTQCFRTVISLFFGLN